MPILFTWLMTTKPCGNSMAFLLRAANFQVQTYPAATDFLEALPKIKAGCVVTDVRMPGMSGIELLQRLRELKVSVPVIVVSGHGDVPLAVEAMKTGALDFIEKPFDDDVFLRAVRMALSAHAVDSQREAQKATINSRLELPLQSGTGGARRTGRRPSKQDHRL